MQNFNDSYLQCNSKRPQTVAYALHDSPVGQLAWITQKFDELSHLPVDRDRILTDVSLYWLTGTAGSAAQISPTRRSPPPTGRARPRHAAPLPPASWSRPTM
ncbi:hypothetical protein ACWGIB_17240 [Streptomyces xiamenensis]